MSVPIRLSRAPFREMDSAAKFNPDRHGVRSSIARRCLLRLACARQRRENFLSDLLILVLVYNARSTAPVPQAAHERRNALPHYDHVETHRVDAIKRVGSQLMIACELRGGKCPDAFAIHFLSQSTGELLAYTRMAPLAEDAVHQIKSYHSKRHPIQLPTLGTAGCFRGADAFVVSLSLGLSALMTAVSVYHYEYQNDLYR